MESIGERLKKAREAKKMSIKDVAKDTNIASSYIESLENEDFDKFPGETYIIGFFRSYSEYLKLDAEEIIQAYKGYKIGESVTPLEELTRPTRPAITFDFATFFKTYKKAIGATAAILVIGIVLFFAKGITSNNMATIDMDMDDKVAEDSADSISLIKKEYEENSSKKKTEIKTIALTNDKGFESIAKGEVAQFLLGTKTISFLLKDIDKNSNIATVEFVHNKAADKLLLAKTKSFVFPEYGRAFNLRLKALTENMAKIVVSLGKKNSAFVEDKVATLDKGKKESAAAKPATQVIAQNKKNLKIVFEADFIAKTYLELYIDGQKKTSGIIPAGTHHRWEGSGFIQVKIGNAGGMKARINNKEYIFGPVGTVANKIIKWKKDKTNPNKYNIVVKDW